MSDPLDVAFVWHMHQPYYRSARTGAFTMPWTRMHALKDYLDLVEMLEMYPDIHQTFNLVPSLVEQLEDYASGDYQDVYWEHTIKPAAELDLSERAFLLERMCEHTDHPRARSHPRYLELAQKRDSLIPQGRETAAQGFTTQELLDLQIWFNLAWFGKRATNDDALRSLLERGRDFCEEDKLTLAQCQSATIKDVLPAYRAAATRSQVELTTSPYFHPILPLLCDTDSARIASADLKLPPRRFAHPEDAAEQLKKAFAKHQKVFGREPRGVWCSEMAVGETTIPLLTAVGFAWTISDEGLLDRSVAGATVRADNRPSSFGTPYHPYRLVRETGEIDIVFRDHTLSDLIGFTYRSWDSREAAADLVSRLRVIRGKTGGRRGTRSSPPLVVIALDGENAWEYYPNEGRDFLAYLYEDLSADDSLRCVTVSEHLQHSPSRFDLDWLHTGSWISADLTTWCGTEAHNSAWDQLHTARDRVHMHRQSLGEKRSEAQTLPIPHKTDLETAWLHIQIAEGSDWFWWFGEHHHTDLDSVWDLEFRVRLQEVYRLLGEPVPKELSTPLSHPALSTSQTMPMGPVSPEVDGVFTFASEWDQAGHMVPVTTTAMQPAVAVRVHEVRFGWQEQRLFLLVAVDPLSLREGLWIEVAANRDNDEERVARVTLQEGGVATISPLREGLSAEDIQVAWKEVVEIALPTSPSESDDKSHGSLVARIGFEQTTAEEFRSSGALPAGAGLP